jgi:16S rRNA (cytidine1402-2'-O)-methyltransferase
MSPNKKPYPRAPSPGVLYLVSTPIGNLEDITLRAIRLLKEVDLIACEDTRRTAKLLAHYGIKTRRQSHHEHNEVRSTPRLLSVLSSGRSVALVSDAGTPLISDPGRRLVSACLQAGIHIIPVPGPSAVTSSLAASNLADDSFCFAGYLPAKAGQRRKRLQELSSVPTTLVFFEAPHRIVVALEDMMSILGARRACMAREMTKLHEEWMRGTLPEILELLRKRQSIKGEITLVIEGFGSEEEPKHYPGSAALHLQHVMDELGLERKEALKQVAKERGVSRRELYQQLLDQKSDP